MLRNLGMAAELLKAKRELQELFEKEIKSRQELVKHEKEIIKLLKSINRKMK